MFKVGDNLKNGAKILAVKYDENSNEYTVLAFYNNSEFVTWKAFEPCRSEIHETFWGHYFQNDLEAALTDFKTR